MACYRKRTGCKEMFAMESSECGCYCFGMVSPEDRQDPELSKRLCIVPTSEDFADVQLEFADKELFVLQQVISGGFLEVLQLTGKTSNGTL